MTVFKKFYENLLSANDKISKNIIFASDLNINVLGMNLIRKFNTSTLLSMFQYNMISPINEPNRVTRNAATIIYHIIRNT